MGLGFMDCLTGLSADVLIVRVRYVTPGHVGAYLVRYALLISPPKSNLEFYFGLENAENSSGHSR